ncbi:MAG: serine protease [Bacteroidota bacterium]|nr:serine protease [Bacteroidota bacterium]
MRTVDLFDNYLEGKLNAQELAAFELRASSDPVFLKALEEHKTLIGILNTSNERQILKNKLKHIHSIEFGKEAKIISINKPEKFTKRIGKTFMVAASAAVIAVISTIALLSTGGYLLEKQDIKITDLGLEVAGLKSSQNAIVRKLNSKEDKPFAAANLEGSAFALNNNGYVITSWHMVNGADSIFIQNSTTERALTKIIFNDPALDIAVLKIENEEVSKAWQVPFTFNSRIAEVGEEVYTLGYPRQDVVYGEGSLSSLSGYSNDSAMYQVSIPVNPGNSGGPVLDSQGNIIGVIRGKITTAEGTGFAVKSTEIIRSIASVEGESVKSELILNNTKSSLKKLKRSEQIKRINPYVFNVLVYKNN